jgi:hypothetical protein
MEGSSYVEVVGESSAGSEADVGGGGRAGLGGGAGEERQARGEGKAREEEQAGEDRLYEAKEVLQKVPKSLVWNFVRYIITDLHHTLTTYPS